MNLHIVPDSRFIDPFVDNLRELDLLKSNLVVVRTNNERLKYIKSDLPFARLYTSRFESLIGSTSFYKNVFIHQLTPLMYRWIARNDFKSLNWMVWGVDLYGLPSLDKLFYEDITYREYVKCHLSLYDIKYHTKVLLTNAIYKNSAYGKIKKVLTWMKVEYGFAKKMIPALKNSEHSYFFYENKIPYNEIDHVLKMRSGILRDTHSRFIIGNSGFPTNNHIDTLHYLKENNINIPLSLPVTYGDNSYIRFLKKKLNQFPDFDIELIQSPMDFNDYLFYLANSRGFIMNAIRPQGFGNILMMMYLGKPVFFNEKNLALSDLSDLGLEFYTLNKLKNPDVSQLINKDSIVDAFSHHKLLVQYNVLFGS